MKNNFDDSIYSEDQIKRFKKENRNYNIKFFFTSILVCLGLFFGWKFITSPPSTTSVCYTWSKATDPYVPYDESGVDGAQWLADNLKTEKDLENIDPDVLSAMRLYDTGAFLEEVDSYERLGLRQFVIDACEKAAPGSTKH
jgi:hypothetical protein